MGTPISFFLAVQFLREGKAQSSLIAMAIAVGVTVAVVGVVPAIVCRERPAPASAAGDKKGVLGTTLEFLKGIGSSHVELVED